MRVGELGEFQLIERVRRLAARQQGRAIVLGIGDDAALLRPLAGHELAVSTDAAVEGVHFDFAHESPTMAGRRAAAAALSDLAAMGAKPLACTLSLSLPSETEVARVLGLIRGLLSVGMAAKAPLVGGNMTRSQSLELHVTAIGEVERGRALRRTGARRGDRLFVSGPLGRSALERRRGKVRHAPEPRLALGRALLRSRRVTACIDLSDGLWADLGHLCAASGVGARIQMDVIPRPRGFARACGAAGFDAEELLLTGGEDYELLFAVRGKTPAFGRVPGSIQPVEIGAVTPSGLELVGTKRGAPSGPGWRHF